MKKKILYGISVLAIAAVAAWNVGLNLNSQNSSNLSDIQLANLEALAQESGGTYYTNRADDYDYANHCYRQCVKDGDSCYYMNNFPYNC